MSSQFVVDAGQIIDQLVIQCWLFQARGGEADAARRNAELALERLLRKGLPHLGGGRGLLFDPYAAANMIKVRVHCLMIRSTA